MRGTALSQVLPTFHSSVTFDDPLLSIRINVISHLAIELLGRSGIVPLIVTPVINACT